MSDIRTRPATKEYRDNWSKVFSKKKAKQTENAAKAAASADIRRRLKG